MARLCKICRSCSQLLNSGLNVTTVTTSAGLSETLFQALIELVPRSSWALRLRNTLARI